MISKILAYGYSQRQFAFAITFWYGALKKGVSHPRDHRLWLVSACQRWSQLTARFPCRRYCMLRQVLWFGILSVGVMISCSPKKHEIPIQVSDKISAGEREIHMANFSLTVPLEWGFYYGHNQVGSSVAVQQIELETAECSVLLRSYKDTSSDALQKWTDGFFKPGSIKRALLLAGYSGVELEQKSNNTLVLIVQGPGRVVVILIRPIPTDKEKVQIYNALNTLRFYQNAKE